MKHYWNEIAIKCSECRSERVLLENRVTAAATIVDMFQIVSELRDMGFGGSAVAFVDNCPEHWAANQFASDVAYNRGIRLQNFDRIRDAERWLAAR